MVVIDKLWTEHLSPLWENIQGFIAKLIQGALDIYNGFILPMWNWFVDTFGGHIVNAFNDTISKIGDFLGVVVDVASYIIDALEGVIDFVAGVFTGDWERAFEGVKNIFKGIVNGMIVIVESFCNYFVRAINKVISAANSLSFNLPDWIPGIGGKSFGLNIPSIKEISLPRLATGAVIPPNREFMAVLGDQKHGNNIEAPEDLIRKIVREEGGGASDYLLREILEAIREGKVLMVGKKQLGQIVSEALSDRTRSAGTAVLTTR